MSHSSDESRSRQVPLAMDAESFRRAGHRLVDQLAEFLDGLPARPVAPGETPSEIRALLPAGGMPQVGQDAEDLLGSIVPLLLEHSTFNGHPKFFGYITASAAPIGALADLVAAAINPNLGGWQLSPAATEIELQTVRWIGEMLGMPPGCHGTLVSGGNMANFSGFLAARRAQTDEAIRSAGLTGRGHELVAYASSETHTWIEKATDLFGHGTDCFRSVPVDSQQRIDVDALRRMIREDRQEGRRGFILVGNAGTVSTGAVDPLEELAEIATENRIWFHVDGAYGAFARLTDEGAALLKGMERADSIAVDPHKWLYSPLEAGCIVTRDPEALRRAFSYSPPYYHFGGEEADPPVNLYEHGMQNSRGFRALKVWLAMRQAGMSGYRQMIGDDIELARRLHRLAEAAPDLEALTRNLSIATFRYVPAGLPPRTEAVERYLDRLNETLLTRVNKAGETFLSNSVINGRVGLRACVVNFRTTIDDIEAVPELIRKAGAACDRTLRPATF